MYTMPTWASPIGLVYGIDPGTINMGVTELLFDFHTYEILQMQSYTLYGPLMLGNKSLIEQNGERYERIQAIENFLFTRFCTRAPHAVFSEAAYINHRRPQAYGALTEAICGVRNALYRYDPWQKLYMVEPSVAKKALTGHGNANKDAIKDAYMARAQELHVTSAPGSISVEHLDEHSNDSGAIAYAGFQLLKTNWMESYAPVSRL